MCTDVTCFHAHCFFPLKWVNTKLRETMEISIQDFFELGKNLIKKICFFWTNRNRLLVFHSLMKNSSIVNNVVYKPCLCPPGCIEMHFVVLDFIHCLFQIWKGQEAVSNRLCLLQEPLVSVQDKISACFSALKSVFTELLFPSSPSFWHMHFFLNQPVIPVVFSCLTSISLAKQMMQVQGVLS